MPARYGVAVRWTRVTWGAIAALALIVSACSSGDADDTSGTADDGNQEATAVECAPERPADSGPQRATLEYDGVEREYQLAVPDSYDGATPAPMILNLHGFSSNIDQQILLSDLVEPAGDQGYLVVTPQALEVEVPLAQGALTTTFWNQDPAAVQPGFEPPDDIGFLNALLDDLESELCLDPDREYVTGMSNGAGMTLALICGSDTRFAAAAPVAGPNLLVDCDATEPIPVLGFHGDADPLVPYDGGAVVGQDYEVTSVLDRMTELATLAGCNAEPTVDEPFEDVIVHTWDGCQNGVDVQLFTVREGGHTWPGTVLDLSGLDLSDAEVSDGQQEFLEGFDFEAVAGHQTESIAASELMLDFFDSHSS